MQEKDGIHRPYYFVGWLVHGAEKRYSTLEKATLAIVITVRKLLPYFQYFQVTLKIDLPIKQVLKILDMMGRP